MGRALFTLPGNDFTPLMSSIHLSAVNSTYPPQNLQDYDPSTPSKASSTTATWTFYNSAAITPVLVAGINYLWNNASAVTFGNSLGFVTSLTNNARDLDGQCIDTWKELTGASRTSSIFFLTVTGANTFPAIGALPICSSFSRIPFKWGGGSGVDFGLDYPDIEVGTTYYGHKILYDRLTKQETLRGTAIRDDGRSILHMVAKSAHGRIFPFVCVPDEDVTKALWVRYSNTTFRYLRQSLKQTTTEIVLEQLVSGPPL